MILIGENWHGHRRRVLEGFIRGEKQYAMGKTVSLRFMDSSGNILASLGVDGSGETIVARGVTARTGTICQWAICHNEEWVLRQLPDPEALRPFSTLFGNEWVLPIMFTDGRLIFGRLDMRLEDVAAVTCDSATPATEPSPETWHDRESLLKGW